MLKKPLLTINNISSYFTILRDYIAHRYLFDSEMNSETKRETILLSPLT